jgi:hypothetical protein
MYQDMYNLSSSDSQTMIKIDGHRVRNSKKQQWHSMVMGQSFKKFMVKKVKPMMKQLLNSVVLIKSSNKKTLTKYT